MSKNIVIGVTGCVAAFKSVQLVSDLVKKGYEVDVIMTKNACEFIQPLQFESLIQRKVMVDTFDRNFQYSTQHISISKKADLFVVVPATANFIAKAVHGICDDMLSTTFLACDCPKIIAPAMNTKMQKQNMKCLIQGHTISCLNTAQMCTGLCNIYRTGSRQRLIHTTVFDRYQCRHYLC